MMMMMTQALMGEILKILDFSEILPVYLIDRLCQLQLPATNTAYLVGFRGP